AERRYGPGSSEAFNLHSLSQQVDALIGISDVFFQAEDGIRESSVTGVQTCALPIYIAQAQEDEDREHQKAKATWTFTPSSSWRSRSSSSCACAMSSDSAPETSGRPMIAPRAKIGRASCRERG